MPFGDADWPIATGVNRKSAMGNGNAKTCLLLLDSVNSSFPNPNSAYIHQ
jgi:hypothetical protein